MQKGLAENIYIFNVPNASATTCTVPIKQIDPYKYSHICFITGSGSTERLLGYADYWTVDYCDGEVVIQCLANDIFTRKDRSADEADGRLGTPDVATMFYSCAFFFNTIPASLLSSTTSMLTSVLERVHWILSGTECAPPYDVVNVFWCSTLAMLMRRLHPPLVAKHAEQKDRDAYYVSHMRKVDCIAHAFEERRLLAEQRVFGTLIKPFLQHGNEKQLLKFLGKCGVIRSAGILLTGCDPPGALLPRRGGHTHTHTHSHPN